MESFLEQLHTHIHRAQKVGCTLLTQGLSVAVDHDADCYLLFSYTNKIIFLYFPHYYKWLVMMGK